MRAMEPFLIRRLRICTKQIPGTLKELFSLAFTLGSPGKEKSLPRECQEKTLFMFPPWVLCGGRPPPNRSLTIGKDPKVTSHRSQRQTVFLCWNKFRPTGHKESLPRELMTRVLTIGEDGGNCFLHMSLSLRTQQSLALGYPRFP